MASSRPYPQTEWGTPYWRLEAAYGDVAQWSLNRWRWEFFRRRDDLRKFFDAWAEISHHESLRCNAGLLPTEPGFLAFEFDELGAKPKQDFGYIGLPNPRIGMQSNGAIIPRTQILDKGRLISGANPRAQSRGVTPLKNVVHGLMRT